MWMKVRVLVQRNVWMKWFCECVCAFFGKFLSKITPIITVCIIYVCTVRRLFIWKPVFISLFFVPVHPHSFIIHTYVEMCEWWFLNKTCRNEWKQSTAYTYTWLYVCICVCTIIDIVVWFFDSTFSSVNIQ